MRSYWIWVYSKYNMTGILIRGRENVRETETNREERHVPTEAEIE